jgi:hypothetical protein
MSDSSRVGRRRQPSLPPAARSPAAIIAAAGLALLAAACGGSPGNHAAQLHLNAIQRTPSSSTKSDGKYLTFAKCMRSRGVAAFPDPVTGTGGHPGFHLQGGSNTDLNAHNPAFQRGIEACQHILGHEFEFTFGPGGAGKGA